MNTDEENDDLWPLLGKAKKPQVSPFFARNVLRAIREEEQERVGVFGWLKRRWAFASLTAGALAIVVAVAVIPTGPQVGETSDTLLLAAHEVSASPDYQVITNLDELLDSERNSIWLEASAY